MLTDDKITARIRALLKLSKSDNVHEAGNAAAQAQALMSRHSITEAMVSGTGGATSTGGDIEVGLLHKHDGKNMPTWKRSLCGGMCEVNQCHGYTHGNELRIIGRPPDADKVRLLFLYVVVEIDRLADQESAMRSNPGRTWKNNFRIGAAQEVNRRLREAFQDIRVQMRQDANEVDTMGTGALVRRVDWALATLDQRRADSVDYGQCVLGLRAVKRRSQRSKDGREAGKRAGASIDLSRGCRAMLEG